MEQETIKAIAKAYFELVKQYVSPREMKLILERNASPDYETSDAVADFMAHEDVLLAAFKSAVGRDADLGLNNDNDLGLICDAHNLAIDKYLTKKA